MAAGPAYSAVWAKRMKYPEKVDQDRRFRFFALLYMQETDYPHYQH